MRGALICSLFVPPRESFLHLRFPLHPPKTPFVTLTFVMQMDGQTRISLGRALPTLKNTPSIQESLSQNLVIENLGTTMKFCEYKPYPNMYSPLMYSHMKNN